LVFSDDSIELFVYYFQGLWDPLALRVSKADEENRVKQAHQVLRGQQGPEVCLDRLEKT